MYQMIKEFLPYMKTEVCLFAHVSPSPDANLKEQSLLEEVEIHTHASYAP